MPVSRLPEFMSRAEGLVRRLAPGADIIAFGHVGDGNMHYNVTPPPGADQDAFLEGEPTQHREVRGTSRRSV